jgi:hypothetical protein
LKLKYKLARIYGDLNVDDDVYVGGDLNVFDTYTQGENKTYFRHVAESIELNNQIIYLQWGAAELAGAVIRITLYHAGGSVSNQGILSKQYYLDIRTSSPYLYRQDSEIVEALGYIPSYAHIHDAEVYDTNKIRIRIRQHASVTRHYRVIIEGWTNTAGASYWRNYTLSTPETSTIPSPIQRRFFFHGMEELHLGGDSFGEKARRDGDISWEFHMDDGDESELTARGWSWSTASPFIAPASTSLNKSRMIVTLQSTANSRYFFNNSGPPYSSPTWAMLTWDQLQSIGNAIGLRWDDGTDNNYIEFLLEVISATQGVCDFRTRYRTGGGAETSGYLIDHLQTVPQYFIMGLHAEGTFWSNWLVRGRLQGIGTDVTWRKYIDHPSGLSWTPQRIGITIRKGNSTATWGRPCIEAIRFNPWGIG